jgi:RNA polymerase sigma-70 factor, ECF subfamily
LYATASSEPVMSAAHAELAQVFQEHHARVFKAAYRITGNASDAEDVLQSVFLRLVRREADAESVDHLDSYLYRAAINAALDLLRSRKQRPSVVLDDSASVVNDSAGSLEIQTWLRQALTRLSPRPAEMFVLRYVEGYDNREIADMLHTSQAVVAVTLHRTRGQLQKDYLAFQRGNHV